MKISTKKPKISSIIAIFLFLIAVFPVYAKDITPEEIISLTNQSRSQNNLKPLLTNEKLNEAAKEKAADMIENKYFAHTSPSNTTPWHWFEVNEYEYKYAGENLAINYEDASSQHQAWMESITHKQNILDPNYQETGAAVIYGKINQSSVVIAIQLFGTPKNKSSANQISSTLNQNNSLVLKKQNKKKEDSPSENDLKFEPSNHFGNDEQKSFVLSSKKTEQITNQLKKTIIFLTLFSLAIILHLNILSAINPKRLHHISTTNIIVLLILFSMLQ